MDKAKKILGELKNNYLPIEDKIKKLIELSEELIWKIEKTKNNENSF